MPSPDAVLDRRTAGRPRIENFALILGAMKSGTTTLYDYLVAHPEIARCRTKEPNFFCFTREWNRGPNHYRSLWRDFDPTRHRWALEASVNYAKAPRFEGTAERIRDFDGRFRYLFIVRDPVDRIESHVAHNIAKGRVTAETYAAMLPDALDVSRYAFQIDTLRATLGEAPLVLDFAELRAAPERTLARCVAFLGIDPGFAFELRPPSNVRPATNGAQAFRIDPETRALLRAALHMDAMRLRDAYGFDVMAWGFGEMPEIPPPVAAAEIRELAERQSPPVRQDRDGKTVAPEAEDTPPARDVAAGPAGSSMRRACATEIVRRLARDARSLVEVGPAAASVAEALDWIPDRTALDARATYGSATVSGIAADPLAHAPGRRYDLALCLDGLAAAPDPGRLARQLLALADRILVSTPCGQAAETGATARRDVAAAEAVLAGWFGRAPDYAVVVEEPRLGPDAGCLLAWFQPPDAPLELSGRRDDRTAARP